MRWMTALLTAVLLFAAADAGYAQFGKGTLRLTVLGGVATHDDNLRIGEVNVGVVAVNLLEFYGGAGLHSFSDSDLTAGDIHVGGVLHFGTILPWTHGVGAQLGSSIGASIDTPAGEQDISYTTLEAFYNFDLSVASLVGLTGRVGVQNLQGDLEDTAFMAKIGLSFVLK